MVSAFPDSLASANGDPPRDRRSALVVRNVSVHGHRTSIRLEPQMWEALAEICRREYCTTEDVCSYVANAGAARWRRRCVFSSLATSTPPRPRRGIEMRDTVRACSWRSGRNGWRCASSRRSDGSLRTVARPVRPEMRKDTTTGEGTSRSGKHASQREGSGVGPFAPASVIRGVTVRRIASKAPGKRRPPKSA